LRTLETTIWTPSWSASFVYGKVVTLYEPMRVAP
jgi:hypothetical protein